MTEATLMQGFESHFADIAGVRTRYFLGGEGPPLVLVHGLGGAAVNFSELAPLLASSRRVLVPDLPGHGRSDPLPSVESLRAYAEHVHVLAAGLDMLPGAVLGYSMGGVVALRLAVARPESVPALVLVATAGIVSVTRRAQIWVALTGLVKPSRVAARFEGRVVRRRPLRRLAFGLWGAHDPAALSATAVRGFLAGARHHTDVSSAGRALLRDDPRQDLERVRCPVLLVWGARDRLVPLADGFEYARRLRAPIRTLAGTGHLLVGERPRECAAVVEAWLDGVGKVDELPADAELVREPARERLDA